MDATLLQLFTPEEILERLGQKKGTGCLHLFTTRQSANIFLKDGVVAASSNGSVEGLEVLKEILTWKDARYAWQPDMTAAGTTLKPLQVPIQDILAQLRPKSDPARRAALAVTSSSPAFPAIGAKGKTTGPLESAGPPPIPKITLPSQAEPSSMAQLAATKKLSLTAHERLTAEETLVKKHPLVLVSVDQPELRLKITRVSGLLGRNPACELPVQHPSISRQHCLLQISDRGLNIKDLGTTNGTRVNGIALTEGYVNVGDKLTFGHMTFTLERDKA